MASDTIQVIFKGRDESLSKVTAGITKSVTGMGKAVATGLKVGATAFVGFGALVGGIGTKLVGLGSDAEEMQGKFNVVFAQTGGQVTAQLSEFADEVGRSKFELMAMASTFGDTLKPMGFIESEAADLSVGLSKLAVDLGSFNNMSTDEALRRLQGTLIGSHENALAFGVIINENTLKAKLAEMGMDDLTGAALEQAKVQARLALLYEGTTDAQGDAARTAGGWANQMRGLISTLKDAATEMGQKLLPIVTPLLSMFGQMAKDAVPFLTAAFESILPTVQGVVEAIQGFVTNLQGGMSVYEAAKEALGGIIPPIVFEKLEWLYKKVTDLIGIFDFLYTIWKQGADFGLMLRTSIVGLARWFGVSSEKAWAFAFAVSDLVDKMKAMAKPVIDWIKQNIELEDVLGALAIILATSVLSAITSVVVAFGPFILAGIALVGVVKLIRDNWDTIQPIAIALKDAVTGLVNAFKSGQDPLVSLAIFIEEVALAFGVSEEKAAALQDAFIKVWLQVTKIKDAIVEAMEPVIEWIKNNIELEDVLIALAVVLGGIVLSAIVSIVAAIGPFILAFVALIGVIALLRKNWDKITAAFAKHKRTFELIRDTIKSVVEWVQKLATGFKDMVIPDFLQRNSPSPIELTFMGLRNQLKGLSQSEMPALNNSMQGLQTTHQRTQNVSQTTNIYAGRVDTRNETNSALRFATGGI